MLKNVRDGHFQVVRFGWIGEYNHLGDVARHVPLLQPAEPHRLGRPGVRRADARRRRDVRPEGEHPAVPQGRERARSTAMPKIPLYFYTQSTLVKPWVQGFSANVAAST